MWPSSRLAIPACTAPPGDFHIDPALPVDRALITHAHCDHARPGSRAYLTARPGEALLRARIGDDAAIQVEAYGVAVAHRRSRASPSIRPATSWARRRSGSNTPAKSGWSPATTSSRPTPPARRSSRSAATPSSPNPPSALPIFRWRGCGASPRDIHALVARQSGGRQAPACCSPTRWARRSACWPALDAAIGPISSLTAPSERINAIYRAQGIAAAASAADGRRLSRSADRSAALRPGSAWLRRFGPVSTAFASGWMRIRGTAPPPLARPRLRPLRPRRLAGPAAGHRRDRRRDGLGDARLPRAAGALARRARQAGGPVEVAQLEAARTGGGPE